ncbi:MAG TPA: acyl-CoA dehydrogenase family protein [Vicinamibacterales bacterium]|nr:acyl-CoA dehydrogenase family protein [Vicinamibacterales bacterium]
MLHGLPDDDARAILWRFGGCEDLRRLAVAARGVARGTVARLVAAGGRLTHEWTPEKQAMLDAFDEAGLGGPSGEDAAGAQAAHRRSLASALTAFELAWVDAGAATTYLACVLAAEPIRMFGTERQRANYAGAAPGGRARRGAFALTEPIPDAGVETGLLGGTVDVAEWGGGREPVLRVRKRGRFITGMAFAEFVTAAVGSADERIKGTCAVILEAGDPGVFDRGLPARTLVHQLSSSRNPVFDVRVPADRILGGYDVENGVIVPRVTHGDIVEAVFRRTRVTVGLMTAAKLLSAVEPIIRYQRRRFRGSRTVQPGSPRYELGLQQKEDVLHRLVDVWATGEAAASLGFAAARALDELDQLAAEGQPAGAGTADLVEEYFAEAARPAHKRSPERLAELGRDPRVRATLLEAVAGVLSPAVKLWNTGHGANVIREAVSLLGGQGLTEDSPGFLGQKWMDAQLEATYEGPEAVQRRQLAHAMIGEVFLRQFESWVEEMRALASQRPGTGTCALATAMGLWLWTLRHLQRATDPAGAKLYQASRQGVSFPMADALAWLLAARQQALDVVELERRTRDDAASAGRWRDLVPILMDLCHVQAARAASEAARICTDLVYGYRRHPSWDDAGASACFGGAEIESLEEVIPGMAATARFYADVIEVDGSHPAKAGPCTSVEGLQPFERLRAQLGRCLTGSRLAKDRAADALTRVEIADAPDYPRPADDPAGAR